MTKQQLIDKVKKESNGKCFVFFAGKKDYNNVVEIQTVNGYRFGEEHHCLCSTEYGGRSISNLYDDAYLDFKNNLPFLEVCDDPNCEWCSGN